MNHYVDMAREYLDSGYTPEQIREEIKQTAGCECELTCLLIEEIMEAALNEVMERDSDEASEE
jgi:hypothetical protein